MNTSMPPAALAPRSETTRTQQEDSVAMDTSDGAISSPVDEGAVNCQGDTFSLQACAATTQYTAVTSHPTAAAAAKHKCNVKGCPSFAPILPLESWSLEACDKVVHPVCYEKLLARAKKNHSQIPDKQFCTIKCQDLYIKESKSSAYTWTNDGQNGKTDPLHSENVLLTWLNTGENFSKWRDPEGAKTKLAVAADLVRLLKSKGCRADRTPTQVQAKICHIEGLMRQAYDFIHSATGEGIKANEPFETFCDKVNLFMFSILQLD